MNIIDQATAMDSAEIEKQSESLLRKETNLIIETYDAYCQDSDEFHEVVTAKNWWGYSIFSCSTLPAL